MTQPDLFAPESPLTEVWTPTRAAALARMAAFRPRMGTAYAGQRNYDRGPGRRDNVSMLSPHVRRRLLTEPELIAAALDAHGPERAEKFIQEVVWRGYWKGWLEMRPGVWQGYLTGLEGDRADAAQDRALRRRLTAAEEGRTGLDCFDAWTQELVETGWLHNHTRMWFASIWVFTLGLPWRLGADFFLRHLLDGDPASNTLGWRWVTGLHTQGKNYAATAWNIEKFTGGRFAPAPRDLAASPPPLSADAPPPAAPLAPADAPKTAAATALLITEEDCSPEAMGLDLLAMRAVATLRLTRLRSDGDVSAAVADFDAGALTDAARRAQGAGAPAATALDHPSAAALADWARDAGATQLVTPWAPVGPTRDWLDAARPALAAKGVTLKMVRRPWDDAVWPHATAGFFKVKARIPRLLETLA